MTRPITSLAAMMLWEEGKFELTDPISEFLPEFVDQRVLQNTDTPDLQATVPRRGNITVEHLLTHTSGLGGRNSEMYRTEKVRLRSIPIEDMVLNAARVPLYEQPGTRWRYGISTTILGRLIEVWSGLSLDTFFEQRIFRPLSMTDTVFWVDDSRLGRFGPVYRPNRRGILQPHQIELVPFTEQPTLTEGGVGLVSTVPDYLRFAQLFLNNGTWNGQQILQPDTVALMTTNRLPAAVLPIGFGQPQPGRGWGLGFCVVIDSTDFPYPVNRGTYWWDGSSGTRFFIDPVYDMVTVIMAAVSPANGNGFREAFTNAVYDAVVN
jgi:CubicO group peptidase (beta-lactamase class C family)